MSRVKKLAVNSFFGVMAFTVSTLLSLILRKYVIDAFGFDLLGLNSIFMTIIGTLSITELGFGMAIVFSLYKPLAENDENKIALLIKLYKKVYAILALVVLILGFAVISFLPRIVNYKFSISEMILPYFLFLIGSILSYFFSFNHTLLAADQKNFMLSIVGATGKIITTIIQFFLIAFFKSYVLYVATATVISLVQNLFLSFLVKRAYPYLKNCSGKLSKEEINSLKTRIGSLAVHKIGYHFLNSIDSIVISLLISVTVAGYYSNYTLISINLLALMTSFFSGLTASFGNIVASEEPTRAEDALKNSRFLCFVLYAISAIGVFVLMDNFLILWIGEETVLPLSFLVFWILNIFLIGYTMAIGELRTASGLFRPDRNLHIILPVFKLGIIVVFARFLGITGIMISATICIIIKEIIVLPHIVYKHLFMKKNAMEYYRRFMLDIVFLIACAGICYFLFGFINTGIGVVDFLLGGFMCVGVTGALLLLVYGRTSEMKYLFNLLGNAFRWIFKKNAPQEKPNP